MRSSARDNNDTGKMSIPSIHPPSLKFIKQVPVSLSITVPSTLNLGVFTESRSIWRWGVVVQIPKDGPSSSSIFS